MSETSSASLRAEQNEKESKKRRKKGRKVFAAEDWCHHRGLCNSQGAAEGTHMGTYPALEEPPEDFHLQATFTCFVVGCGTEHVAPSGCGTEHVAPLAVSGTFVGFR